MNIYQFSILLLLYSAGKAELKIDGDKDIDTSSASKKGDGKAEFMKDNIRNNNSLFAKPKSAPNKLFETCEDVNNEPQGIGRSGAISAFAQIWVEFKTSFSNGKLEKIDVLNQYMIRQ